MALTIIYIGIISYISSGSFCILEAIKTTKPSRSLSCFSGVNNQAQMPNKHILLHSRFVEFLKTGRGRPHPLYTNRSYPTFSPTLVQLNIALYSALRRPMSQYFKVFNVLLTLYPRTMLYMNT